MRAYVCVRGCVGGSRVGVCGGGAFFLTDGVLVFVVSCVWLVLLDLTTRSIRKA